MQAVFCSREQRPSPFLFSVFSSVFLLSVYLFCVSLVCFPFNLSLFSVFCHSLPYFSARHLQRIGFPPYVHSTFTSPLMQPLTPPLTRTCTSLIASFTALHTASHAVSLTVSLTVSYRSSPHSQPLTRTRTSLIASRSSLSFRLTFSYRIKNGILFHENVLSGTEGAEKPVLYEENVLDGTKRCVTWII